MTRDVEFIVSYVHITTIVFGARRAILSYLMYVMEIRENVRRVLVGGEQKCWGSISRPGH